MIRSREWISTATNSSLFELRSYCADSLRKKDVWCSLQQDLFFGTNNVMLVGCAIETTIDGDVFRVTRSEDPIRGLAQP